MHCGLHKWLLRCDVWGRVLFHRSSKILDQRVANLEKRRDCKGKGLPNGLITGPLARDYSFAALTASTKGLVGLLGPIVPSGLEGNLRTHRECIQLGAGTPGVGRADLFGDVAVQVVEHETYVAIDVPVQTRAVDCLLATGSAVFGPQLIVQIHGADAAGNLPRSPTSAPYRERIAWDDAAISGVGWNVGVGFAC